MKTIKLNTNCKILVGEFLEVNKLYQMQKCSKEWYDIIVPQIMYRIEYNASSMTSFKLFKRIFEIMNSDDKRAWASKENSHIFRSL